MENQKLLAQIILEVLGRPPEHLKEALKLILERLGAEKGVKVKSSKIHEPKQVEDTKDMFTTFAEVTIELDSLENYFGILFGYLPSHIELLEPQSVALSNFQLNELANKLTTKLHSYDAIVKKTMVDREILLAKLKEIAPHLFQKEESQEAKTLEQALSKSKSNQKKAKKAKKKK